MADETRKVHSRLHLDIPMSVVSGQLRSTRCGRPIGSEVYPGEFQSGEHIIRVIDGMEGVTCHWCRWGRS